MKSEREQSRFIKNISYRGAPYTNNFWKNTFSQSISNALEFNDPLHNRELERASQTRSPTGESKHSLFSSKVQQTKPEEWIIGVKFKKNPCVQANVQSVWAIIMTLCDKQIHTYQSSNYLSNLLLWACDDTGLVSYCCTSACKYAVWWRLSGKLTWVQMDWFCCELAWHKTWVVPLTWLWFKDKRSYHYGSVAVSLSGWPTGRRRRWLDVFVDNSTYHCNEEAKVCTSVSFANAKTRRHWSQCIKHIRIQKLGEKGSSNPHLYTVFSCKTWLPLQ